MGRHGRFDVGAGQRAARDTRARSAAAGALSLGPRPQGQRHAGAGDAARAAVSHGAPVRRSVVRDRPQGPPEVSAAGEASPVAMSPQGAGQVARGTARRRVGRSVRPAPAAAAALRARGAKAGAQLEARNQRGRGPKRLAPVSACRPAVVAMGQRSSVEDRRGLRLTPDDTPRLVRAYRGPPARVDHDRQATVEVRVDAAAVEATLRRWGGRVSGTHPPLASWSRAPAVLASRRAYQGERRCGRRTGRPLSLTPL
jgi:hypothetical protein